MAVWELALIIFAVTYMMVNMVVLVVQLKMMARMAGVTNKVFKMAEKVIDKTEPFVDKMLDEMDDFYE